MAAQPPASITSNEHFGLTIEVEDASGNVVPTFNGNVTVVLVDKHQAGKLHGTTTVAAINGIATFSGLTMAKAGKWLQTPTCSRRAEPRFDQGFQSVSIASSPSKARKSTAALDAEFVRSVSA